VHPSALLFGVPVALAAFLLFLVQPILARTLLTWFGGGPAVWTTCLLFFQTALLVGYAYAHWLQGQSGRTRLLVHGGLIVASLAFLPLHAREAFKPEGAESPQPLLLAVLAVSIGLPYLALAATSPLVQRLASAARPGRDAYRLTALSNAASLLGLLIYPFALEPAVTLATQEIGWSLAFLVFAIAMISLLSRTRTLGLGAAAGLAAAALPPERPARRRAGVLDWLALTIFPSMLLAAVTNELCLEVAPVPLLWVLPLAIYLITFVIAFEYPGVYRRTLFAVPVLLAALGIALLGAFGVLLSMPAQIAGYSLALFLLCLACHGELARLRPAPARLTLFHLMIAAGGALGSAFVALAAPLLFDTYLELHVAVAGCSIALFVVWIRSRMPVMYAADPRADAVALLLWGAGIVMVLWTDARAGREGIRFAHRDFHGAVAVIRHRPGPGESGDHYDEFDVLRHGRIQHGLQFTAPERRGEVTSYYCRKSGLYLGLAQHEKRLAGSPMRIGVIGLGVGTVAAFGAAGDVVRFYELSPAVDRIAREHFSYLSDAAAKIEVVLGDARISLERELRDGRAQEFDLLVVDAFASDSIPRHLITKEAFALYAQHLAAGGVLAIQVSNHFLDLDPLVYVQARDLGLRAHLFYYRAAKGEIGCVNSTWVLCSDDPAFFERPAVKERIAPWPEGTGDFEPWSDDFGGLLSVMRWK
jgi:MFS family permease